MVKRITAEAFGTFTLVLLAIGPSVLGGFDPSSATGRLATSLSTGLAVASMVYMVGHLSGAHINPAVTIGYVVAGRFRIRDTLTQFTAQFLGAVLGALAVASIARGAPSGATSHYLGATGWDWAGGASYAWWSAFAAEAVATFVFVTTFLTIRHEKNPTPVDGLVIGLTASGLLLAVEGVSGGSLNPARSLGPALVEGGAALSQLWLYFVAPSLGAAIAGLFSRAVPLYDRGRVGLDGAADRQDNRD